MDCDIIFSSVEILYVKLIRRKNNEKDYFDYCGNCNDSFNVSQCFAASDSTANANEILKFLKDYSYTT